MCFPLFLFSSLFYFFLAFFCTFKPQRGGSFPLSPLCHSSPPSAWTCTAFAALSILRKGYLFLQLTKAQYGKLYVFLFLDLYFLRFLRPLRPFCVLSLKYANRHLYPRLLSKPTERRLKPFVAVQRPSILAKSSFWLSI